MKKRDHVEIILEKMFEICGEPKTFEEILAIACKDPKWFSKNHMTQKQVDEWFVFGIKTIKQRFRVPSSQAESMMSYINLMWGPVVVEEPKKQRCRNEKQKNKEKNRGSSRSK